MDVGFTGTRHGMTDAQVDTVNAFLSNKEIKCVHHGDCVGADTDFHGLATDSGLTVVIHPPEDDRLRAWNRSDDIREPKPYLARNRDIVDESDFLIATPETSREEPKGGTWYTIRYARAKKPVLVVWPDGDIWEQEPWDEP